MEKRDDLRSRLGLALALAGLLSLALLFSAGAASGAGSAAAGTCVPGPHSGVITGTQTWCFDDSPHLLSSDVTVPAGMTVTVEADAIVQGARYVELLVVGHLEALGTASQPITFTSSADSGPEQWSGLAFDGGTGHLRYATVRYSGDRNTVADSMFGNPYHRSDLTVRNGTLRLENSTVRDLSTLVLQPEV